MRAVLAGRCVGGCSPVAGRGSPPGGRRDGTGRHPVDLPARRGRNTASVSRIDWARRSGEEVETVTGILLCRRHSNAERVTPSQGDDGLDVILREDDGWTIWQVKKYTKQPTSSQRAKIAKSFEKAIAFATREKIKIKNWYLVMPASPTTTSLKWFREMIDGQPFSCTWLGEDFLDGLASESPDVVDYYFRDGKDRLAVALAQFAQATGSGLRPADDELTPQDATSAILATHNLINSLDPHFRYDFSVDSRPPELANARDAIFVEARGTGDQYVTIRVYEKYRGALNDRPITLNGTFHTPDDETRRAVRDFFEFGAPLVLEDGFATLEADLPGGLDGSRMSGAIRIVKPDPAPEDLRVMRIRTIDAASSDEQVARLAMRPATTGVDRKNLLSSATELSGGTFTVEHRYTGDSDMMKLTFALNDLSGRKPERVLPGLKFLRSLTPGRFYQLGQEFGPFMGRPIPIEKDISHLVSDNVLELVEAIAHLQSRTAEQLTIPDLETLSKDAGDQIVAASSLLRGDAVDVSIPEINVTPNGSPIGEGDHALLLTVNHEVSVNDVVIPIGMVAFHAPAARIAAVRDADGAVQSVRATAIDEGPLRGTLRLTDTN
jgi:hypothetical protein